MLGPSVDAYVDQTGASSQPPAPFQNRSPQGVAVFDEGLVFSDYFPLLLLLHPPPREAAQR